MSLQFTITLSGVGLRPLACWDCGLESRRRHGCLSVVSFVCCNIDFSTSGWSFVQRSPTGCDVCECDRERALPPGGCWLLGHGKNTNNKKRWQRWLLILCFCFVATLSNIKHLEVILIWYEESCIETKDFVKQGYFFIEWCVIYHFVLDGFILLLLLLCLSRMYVCVVTGRWDLKFL